MKFVLSHTVCWYQPVMSHVVLKMPHPYEQCDFYCMDVVYLLELTPSGTL